MDALDALLRTLLVERYGRIPSEEHHAESDQTHLANAEGCVCKPADGRPASSSAASGASRG